LIVFEIAIGIDVLALLKIALIIMKFVNYNLLFCYCKCKQPFVLRFPL